MSYLNKKYIQKTKSQGTYSPLMISIYIDLYDANRPKYISQNSFIKIHIFPCQNILLFFFFKKNFFWWGGGGFPPPPPRFTSSLLVDHILGHLDAAHIQQIEDI